MIIQHNIPAINAHRNLGINNNATAKNLEKLSSGYRINRAGDDAAGLAISEKMRGQIRGLQQATRNAENGISLIQTAEGGLNETHAILQRMRELAVQSANGTYQNNVDREALQLEFHAITSEIDRISTSTHYNGINLLDGSLNYDKVTSTTVTTNTSFLGQLNFSSAAITDGNYAATDIELNVEVNHKGDITNLTSSTPDVTITHDADTGVYTISHTDGTGTATFTLNNANITNGPNGGFAGGTVVVAVPSTNKDGTAAVGAGTVTAITASDWVLGDGLIFQIGANGRADQEVALRVNDMSSGAIGVNTTAQGGGAISIHTRDRAKLAIDAIDTAINTVSMQRAGLGALQNRLEHTVNNLGVTTENLQAAESSIRDVDMAKEMMEFTKNSILVQASQAMLAQANALPQGVLSLLG